MIGHGGLLRAFSFAFDKVFWAYLGDLPPDMPRRSDTLNGRNRYNNAVVSF